MFKLEFETDNAAFTDGIFPFTDTSELIAAVSHDVANGETAGIVRDSDGNTVGGWVLSFRCREQDQRTVRNMSAWVDEILEQISDSEEAARLAARIMSHFNLPGAVFSREDVTDEIAEYVSGDPYSELDADDYEVLTDEYLSSGDWDTLTSLLYQTGNEAITEGVAERMRELGV